MFRPYIIVNATALDKGGGLTILKQFIEAVPEDGFNYLFFIHHKISLENRQSNIQIVTKDVKSIYKRIIWDIFGLKRYLQRNNIIPVSAISLQNTNFRVGHKIPNYIYYHQSIPFYDISWSPFKREQRSMWFYKHIYPFFVIFLINSRTEIFVQLNFIKAGFLKRFGFPSNRIHILTPNINISNISAVSKIELEIDKINLFYPAMPYFYKNHKVIIQAISKLKNPNITLYLTCNRKDFNEDLSLINIRFMGAISYEEVIRMYCQSDALLFPSYIETFGLPLIEAASFGLPIIAADLPYSNEVLKNYQGVEFVDHSDADKWATAISKIKKYRKFSPLSISKTNSWEELFKIVKQNI